MKDILFKIINQFTKGVDTYHNNGSMWLIFTDEKKWVIELTKEGTLWYNFYFFQDCFKYLSLDVVENQHYITEWVEDTIQNGVRYTVKLEVLDITLVEDTIQNGVKHTEDSLQERMFFVEDTIENGVKQIIKETIDENHHRLREVVVTLKDGIKDIKQEPSQRTWRVDNVIKKTHEDAYHNKGRVEGVIRNGIIETRHGIHFFEDTTENVIKNGVKETKSPGADGDLLSTIEWMESNNAESVPEMIDNVIENGIKEVKELPDQSGELKGYSDYYNRQEDRTYPHTKTVDDVIRVGIKETNWRKVDNFPEFEERVIDNGIKL